MAVLEQFIDNFKFKMILANKPIKFYQTAEFSLLFNVAD